MQYLVAKWTPFIVKSVFKRVALSCLLSVVLEYIVGQHYFLSVLLTHALHVVCSLGPTQGHLDTPLSTVGEQQARLVAMVLI